MMVALLLNCYAAGTRCSRKFMRPCRVDVACRVIVGNDVPDFRTVSDIRKTHLARLVALFVEVLNLCALAGLVKVGTNSPMRLPGPKAQINFTYPESRIMKSSNKGWASGCSRGGGGVDAR